MAPGGHVDENETPPQAAEREVFEETGLKIEFLKQENCWIEAWNGRSIERPYMCVLFDVPPQGSEPAHQHIDFIYVAKPVGGSESCHLNEAFHMKWFSLEEISLLKTDQEIFGDTKKVIESLLCR